MFFQNSHHAPPGTIALGSLSYGRLCCISTHNAACHAAETKYNHLTAENEKQDSEIRRLHRAVMPDAYACVCVHMMPEVHCAMGMSTSSQVSEVLPQLEAAKIDREKVNGDISFRNTRIEEV